MPGQPNWNLEEFRTEIARRLQIPAEEMQFFGERLRAARKVAMHADAELGKIIRLGFRDDLVEMPDGVVIPYKYDHPLDDSDDW